MISILMVCHGNICRSPMAEFVFRDIVHQNGMADQFLIASAATSTEEIGNPPHHGTRNLLAQKGISTAGKQSVQLKASDYDKYDYLIGMDQANIRNMHRILKRKDPDKIFRLLDLTKNPRDIADPWYTGNFEITYEDVLEGCKTLFKMIQEESI